MVAMRIIPQALAQEEAESFIPKTYPTLPYQNPAPARYNLKFGNLEARIYAAATGEFNDNINLSAKDRQSDLSFGPNIKVGFIYPVSEIQLLQFNLGFGYMWYLNHPSLATFNIDPDTRLDYKLTIHKSFVLSFYDNFLVQSDPTTLPTLSGGSSLLDFRRIVNVAGVTARWQASEKLGFMTGYSYTYDRSLTPLFENIDRDTHSFNAGAFYALNSLLNVGVLGGYSFTIYRLSQQNNGSGSYFGPTVSFKPTKNITLAASVFYAANSYDQNGALHGGVTDTSSFSGITYAASVTHRLNAWFTHDIKASRSTELGLGSNFNETTVLQYDATVPIRRGISGNATFAYQKYAASGVGGETGDIYMFYLGANCSIARRWGLGASYVLSWKEASMADHNYLQDRISLQLSHEF